jgi:hypothetical protein
MKRNYQTIVAAVILSGCTVPDVTPEVAASVDLLAATDGKLRPSLKILAAQELRQSEDALLASGDTVYETSNCDESDEFGLMTDCQLDFLGNLDEGPVNATQALTALNDIEAYFATLLILASDDDSNAVRAQAQELAKALDEVGEGKSEALATLAKDVGKRGDTFVAASGFLADQNRIAALRSVVRRADPIIASQTEIIAAYLDLDGELAAAHSVLVEAEAEVVEAQAAKDTRRYRKAIEDLKAVHRAYRRAQEAAPSYAMKLLRDSHAQLLARLSSGGSPEDILKTLTEIETVIKLAKEDK